MNGALALAERITCMYAVFIISDCLAMYVIIVIVK